MDEDTDLVLEFLTPEDADEVSAIAYSLFYDVYSETPREIVDAFLERFQTPEAIREQMRTGSEYAFIISRGERAGYLAFEIDDEGMHLSKLYLLEGFRDRGIGGRIVGYVEDRARAAGVGRIHLDVNMYNKGAIQFYERHGFVLRGRMEYVRLLMVKGL